MDILGHVDPTALKMLRDLTGLEALNITAENINGENTGAIGLSHGTDVELNARELINKGIANISTVIGCRDDIMAYLVSMNINSTTAFDIMESVRKGKDELQDFQAQLEEEDQIFITNDSSNDDEIKELSEELNLDQIQANLQAFNETEDEEVVETDEDNIDDYDKYYE
ncbi:hypothetical protein FQA39_LY12900 [Lamprigera yunnana]|nr:hypothetical protein FQA39_LY12900 [Lamprigera yunnana]